MASPEGQVDRPGHHGWSLTGAAGALALQWLLLLLVARLGGPVAAGRFALALAVTGPVILLAGLGFRHAQMADPMVDGRLPTYVALRGVTLVLAVVAILLIAALGPFDHATSWAITLVGLAKAAESGGEVTHGFLQRRGRFDLVARSLLGRGVLGVMGLGLGMAWGGLIGGLVGLCLAWAASTLTIDRANLHREAPGLVRSGRVAGREVRGLLEATIPLGAVALLWATALNLPRYFLEGLHGPAALGRFAVAASLIVPAGAVANAVGQSGSRVLALRMAAGDHAAPRERWWWAIGIGAALGVGVLVAGLLLGPWLVREAFGPAFALTRRELAPFLLAGALGSMATLFDYLILAAGRFRLQLGLGALVWVTTAVASAAWVPRRGVGGAALALAVAAIVHLALAAGAAWRLAPRSSA